MVGETTIEILKKRLMTEEAVRLKPYVDSVGKLTIGVGRNLTDKGLRMSEVEFMLQNDVEEVIQELHTHLPWTDQLDDARASVLLDMAFNMGIDGLLTFKNTLAAMQRGDYAAAAEGMRHSKWAEQVGNRDVYLIKVMETGEL